VRSLANALVAASIYACAAAVARAHPGSGIVADARGNIYFVDTGQGVWKLDAGGRLSLLHTLAYHWMALDEGGHFAESDALGDFDRGSFVRITPAGSVPALILSSDYPVAVGQDGGLYYVPYDPKEPRQLVRKTPLGRRAIFATLPPAAGPEPMQWVNDIAVGPAGALYVADNDAVRKIERDGSVSVFREAIVAPDCADPLPDSPRLPYLRGLAIAADGTIYAAANGCRTVIAIPARGPIRTVLRSEAPWSPTSVALVGKDVVVLEYLHTPGDDRREWIPRVRKVTPGGAITTIATIPRRTERPANTK
jgi:sugar lactone lactonase YvrE